MSRTKKPTKKRKSFTYVPYPEDAPIVNNVRPSWMNAQELARLERDIRQHLDEKMKAFLDDKDSFAALECFEECHRCNLFPPVELLEFLTNHFSAFLTDLHLTAHQQTNKKHHKTFLDKVRADRTPKQRKQSLEQRLGLVGGHKSDNRFSREALEHKYYRIYYDFLCWTKVFGCKDAKAHKLLVHQYAMDGVRNLFSEKKPKPVWQAAKGRAEERFSPLYEGQTYMKKEFVNKYAFGVLKNILANDKRRSEILSLHREYKENVCTF